MMELIPAIDIIDGRCVRLTQGRYDSKTTYPVSPADMAAMFEDHGIRRLHVVDLDGARTGKVRNWKALEQIAARTNLIIDFGGGIQTDADMKRVFECGAKMATIGSIAISQPQRFATWIGTYGPDAILPGADVKEEKLAIRGWTQQTDISLPDFIKQMLKLGISQMFCTDVSKDGQLMGPSVELYKKTILENPGIRLIASGGIRSVDDLRLLRETGCTGAIIGKALYEGYISLNELRTFI
ncbi:MAG: 1-(5-phosphoribosyl)-5-[(5-phosphoribosylamino)methylideneamino]imidazole-4-carboxamide isomerase [Bacteroidetes bacterium]|nr:1-(5-phosphoribosyl)-5-[(5-phosphoribosylamino)methylideneamino]imidazole-4-carboxamide isomerase [Bacteroidota bacterium]